MTLSEQALEVLALLKQLNGNRELVFPGERDLEKPKSNMTILEALKRIGYRGEMAGHGFEELPRRDCTNWNTRMSTLSYNLHIPREMP